MARPPLPAHDLAAHAAWVAAALAAPFHEPRQLPRLVHPKREPAPVQEREPDLVDMMKAPPPKPELPEYLRRPMPIQDVMRAHFGDALTPRTPLAEKRARLKRERAEAAIAARAAKPGIPAPKPRTPLAEKRLRLRRERAAAALAEMTEGYVDPDPYLLALDLEILEDLRDLQGSHADAAVTALNRRRPPGFPNATRIIALRTMEQEVAVTLLLQDEASARVTLRWKPLDRAYEWRDADLSSRPVRHCWADDTGEWITLPL